MTPTEHKFEPNLASPNKTNRANNDTEAAGGSQIGSDGNSQYETASLSQSGTTQSVSESVVADQPKVEPKFFKVYNHEYENTDPKQYAVTNSAAVEFIEVIRQEQKKGYGFLPWIGAGLSAPSGIPLVAEIKAYLERCIALALGVEGDNSSPWNPRTDAWPPYHDARRVHDKTSYFKVKTEFEIRREKGTWDPELAIFWEAIGAMAEWRTALLFLSRLKREKQGLGMEWPMILALDAPNPEVIDAGLRAIIGHKNPSLGHRMMAALAGLLRLDILITTNFDNLLEAAFERSRNPLTTSPLELVNHFPSAASLAGRRTLIKIHGGERSLRADYSLDAPPTEEDCWRFLQYLTTPDSRRKMLKELSSGITPGSLDFRSHLLITGFSAGEKRTRTFIGHAWKYLRPDFKVFWLCHSNVDVQRIYEFTTDFFCNSDQRLRNDPIPRSLVLRYTDQGLFFLQMFQTLRFGLPASGIIFPSISRLPHPPLHSIPERSRGQIRNIRILADEIVDRVELFQKNPSKQPNIQVVSSPNDVFGATSACAQSFEYLERDNICLWFDMNDVSSTADFFEKLLDAAYYRLGEEHWIPMHVTDDPEKRAKTFSEITATVPKNWVIFINARETPAANSLDPDNPTAIKYPNSWLDDPTSHLDVGNRAEEDVSRKERQPEGHQFAEMMATLAGPDSKNVSIVFLCRQPSVGVPSNFQEVMKRYGIVSADALFIEGASNFGVDDIAKEVLRISNTVERLRFLHTICLMQRTRYVSIVWNDIIFPEFSSLDPSLHQEVWLSDLEDQGLLKRHLGGFIWLDSRVRNVIREILQSGGSFTERCVNIVEGLENRELIVEWKYTFNESIIHHRLALWYRDVMHASASPAALFEAVHHASYSSLTRLKHINQIVSDEKMVLSESDYVKDDCLNSFEMLDWASVLMRSHLFLSQTQGFSRDSCRILRFIRDSNCDHVDRVIRDLESTIVGIRSLDERHVDASIADIEDEIHLARSANLRLKIRATETMRAIGREVGEITKAYNRHKRIAELFGISRERRYVDSLAEVLRGGAFRTKFDLNQVGGCLEWLRWLRWSAMLGIEARSYHLACSSLMRAFKSLRLSKEEYDLYFSSERGSSRDNIGELIVEIQACSNVFKGDLVSFFGEKIKAQPNLRLEMCRLLEQAVECILLQISAIRRCRDVDGLQVALGFKGIVSSSASSTGFDRSKLKSGLMDCIGITNRLMERVQVGDSELNSRHSYVTMWCKGRVRIHQSIGAVLDAPEGSSGDHSYETAMGFLSSAEAYLGASDPSRRNSDLAIIELYRAEVRLRQADRNYIAFRDLGEGGRIEVKGRFSLLRNKIYGEYERMFPQSTGTLSADFKDVMLSNYVIDHPGMGLSNSLISDAMRFLDRAEEMLRGRRRNVWWTTWLFERRLRSIAWSIWSSIPNEGSSIPFLGLDSYPRNTDTVADVILVNSIRMVRLDAYRLVSIVDAYAECMFALRLRIICDGSVERMPYRQSYMLENLVSAISTVEMVYKTRKNPVEGRLCVPNEEMDLGVENYITGMIRTLKRRVEYLRQPLPNLNISSR